MSLRKKCIYVAMAAVFTAQTAAAQGILQEFITQAAIDNEVARQTPIVVGAIAKATNSVRPVAGTGIAVNALADGSGTEVSLTHQLNVGDMYRGALVVSVCPDSGLALLMPVRREEATRVQWSTCTSNVRGMGQGLGSGAANTGLLLATAGALGCEAPAAQVAAEYTVDAAGNKRSTADAEVSRYESGPMFSPFSMFTPGDVDSFAHGRLGQINEALVAAGGRAIAPGLYWLAYEGSSATLVAGNEVRYAAALRVGTDGSVVVEDRPITDVLEVLMGWYQHQ